MDETAHAGAFGRVDEGLDVGDRSLEGHVAIGKADPIGIEDGVDASERSGERVGVAEVEWRGFDGIAERVGTRGMSSERADAVAAVEKEAGDIAAGVTEGAGDDVEAGWQAKRSFAQTANAENRSKSIGRKSSRSLCGNIGSV